MIPSAFNTINPVEFPLFKAPFKILFGYGTTLRCRISFNVLHVLKSLSVDFLKLKTNCIGGSFEDVEDMKRNTVAKRRTIFKENFKVCLD